MKERRRFGTCGVEDEDEDGSPSSLTEVEDDASAETKAYMGLRGRFELAEGERVCLGEGVGCGPRPRS